MENIFGLLILACFVLLVIGFFSPATSLFWYKQERTRKKSAKFYLIGILISFVLFGIFTDKSNKKITQPVVATSSKPIDETTEPPQPTGIGMGQILHTSYFDIVVNRIGLQSSVNTGNEFADLPPENGIKYLIINATFKNTDNESRILFDGSVWINYNNKEYEYDKSETVMAEGWGLFLDQINPLTTKNTNLVYKLPNEIKGAAYWQPGRASSDEKIFLGNLE